MNAVNLVDLSARLKTANNKRLKRFPSKPSSLIPLGCLLTLVDARRHFVSCSRYVSDSTKVENVLGQCPLGKLGSSSHPINYIRVSSLLSHCEKKRCPAQQTPDQSEIVLRSTMSIYHRREMVLIQRLHRRTVCLPKLALLWK